VATSADVGIGNVHLFGSNNGGIDVDFDDMAPAASDVTRLVLDAEIGVGEVRVHDPQAELEFRDDFGGFDPGEPNLDGNAACSPTGASARG
jgi:hypothetical protein